MSVSTLKSALRQSNAQKRQTGHTQFWIDQPNVQGSKKVSDCGLCQGALSARGPEPTSRGSPLVRAAELSGLSEARLNEERQTSALKKIGQWQNDRLSRSWQRYLGARMVPLACHDWRCNCDLPLAVRTNERRQRRLNRKAPTVYRKSIMMPTSSNTSGSIKVKPFMISDTHLQGRGHLQRYPAETVLVTKLKQYRPSRPCSTGTSVISDKTNASCRFQVKSR